MSNITENRSPSRLEQTFAVGHMPLVIRLALFILFTLVLVGITVSLLPTLVVLGQWGYVAAFIINGLSSASVVVPVPGLAAIAVMARDLNPLALGLAAGIGGTIGELSGYWLGAQGREPLEGNRIYGFAMGAMDRMGGLILVIFGLVPVLPVDAAGIIAGATRYPIPKFLLYLGIGKSIMLVVVLYLTARAFEWAEPYLMWLG